MGKTINSLLLAGSIMLTAGSCISQTFKDRIMEDATHIVVEDVNDKIKVYNFINEGKYDSAKLFLDEEFNKYVLVASEVKGRIDETDVISRECKERINARLDSSINEVQKCLKTY